MTLEEFESVVEDQIFSLHKIEVSSHQIFSNNVPMAYDIINRSDEFSSHYVAMEKLRVAELSVTGVVVNIR